MSEWGHMRKTATCRQSNGRQISYASRSPPAFVNLQKLPTASSGAIQELWTCMCCFPSTIWSNAIPTARGTLAWRSNCKVGHFHQRPNSLESYTCRAG